MVTIMDEETTLVSPLRQENANRFGFTLFNFVFMAILFSANHGCTVACLALATARLGQDVGAWQSGTLYITYTASAVLGATFVVKKLGARNAIFTGMSLYCAYVGCFFIATQFPQVEIPAALIGAAIGGVGGGFLWTAQGAYFAKASEEYALEMNMQNDADDNNTAAPYDRASTTTAATSFFAGVFAFIYLTLEVALRSLSSALVAFGMDWGAVFAVYTLVALVSTAGVLVGVHNYQSDNGQEESSSAFYKVTAAWQLLKSDAKMKYMIGLNAVFGFSGAFLNSYVNGQVVRVALNDQDSRYVGVLSALVAAVAAVCSLVFSRVKQKGPVLILGAMAFFGVAFPFLIMPDVSKWGWGLLICIYSLQGVGRSTFEGTLKATFADYFPHEREGAFANIILQNGLSSAIGFFLSFRLTCNDPSSAYCVTYKDGTLHDVLSFELLVTVTAVLAILGYWRASILFHQEQESQDNNDCQGETELLENQAAVSA